MKETENLQKRSGTSWNKPNIGVVNIKPNLVGKECFTVTTIFFHFFPISNIHQMVL